MPADEPWFLFVPPGSSERMSDGSVVPWYRWRMRVELSFGDFKVGLGVRRGLRFEVNRAEKIARMLVCLAIVCTILLALSQTALARRVRTDIKGYAVHGCAILTIPEAERATLPAAVMECWTCGVLLFGLDEVLPR